MEKKTQLTTAVIGLGNIGKVVATNLVKGNRSVIVADRSLPKAKTLAKELGSLARPLEIAQAIKEADIVVLAIWFAAIKEVLVQYAAELEGKIIVDPSNPIALDGKGGFVKTIGEKESAGRLLSALLPKGAKLLKAFGTLGAATLSNAAFAEPERKVLLYATDNRGIDAAAQALIHDSGFEALRVGDLDQSIRIEVFGDLHEYGKLGKAVTLAEAEQELGATV